MGLGEVSAPISAAPRVSIVHAFVMVETASLILVEGGTMFDKIDMTPGPELS